MCTVGSIDVERSIKPVKHEILTKKRNRLLDPKPRSPHEGEEDSLQEDH